MNIKTMDQSMIISLPDTKVILQMPVMEADGKSVCLKRITADEKNKSWQCEADGFLLKFKAEETNGRIRIYSSLINNSGRNTHLGEILPFGHITISKNYGRTYISSKSMIGFDGIFEKEIDKESYSLFGFTCEKGNGALLFGFTRPDDAFYRFTAKEADQKWELKTVMPRENSLLLAGASIEFSPFEITWGNSLSALLEQYGETVAENMKAKKIDSIKTGWCSWYHYYGFETQEDIINNVKMLANSPLKEHIEVIQIDDGWNQKDNTSPCVWGDWLPGGKFPMGMKYIVEIIHEHGFEAGLWLAPFSVTKDSMLFKNHPNWLVKADDNGLLAMVSSDRYGLDLTQTGTGWI